MPVAGIRHSFTPPKRRNFQTRPTIARFLLQSNDSRRSSSFQKTLPKHPITVTKEGSDTVNMAALGKGPIIFVILCTLGGCIQLCFTFRALKSGSIKYVSRNWLIGGSGGKILRTSEPGWFWFSILISIALALILLAPLAWAICHENIHVGASKSVSRKHVFTVGMQEDWKLVLQYSGTERNNLMMWTHAKDKENAPFKFTLEGMYLPPGVWYTNRTTQYNDAHVTGSLQPLDTNWEYFSGTVQVESQVPIDIVFSGFYSTNGLNTNEDGTIFALPPGKTNLSFVCKLVAVFDIPKSTIPNRR